jgi:phosphate/sulfate permease
MLKEPQARLLLLRQLVSVPYWVCRLVQRMCFQVVLPVQWSLGGKSNLNKGTLKSIGLAWVLTLPVSIGLALILFVFFHLLFS